ncbi:hypothetical protein HDU96_002660 [Phlyctochytrium bullatum]|nr:hypothetical protein HDU96_002660 [Phlyctochytrium bullatum]
MFTSVISNLIAVLAVATSVATAAPVNGSTSVNVVPRAVNPDFPPFWIQYRKCASDGPVRVCVLNRGLDNRYPRLQVFYSNTGYLWPQGSPLSVWASINGKSGAFGKFAADAGNPVPSASFQVGYVKDTQICYQSGSTDSPGYVQPGYYRCPVTAEFPVKNGAGEVVWFYRPADPREVAIIPKPSETAWDIQVAIYNDKNNWDSKFGANYRFNL